MKRKTQVHSTDRKLALRKSVIRRLDADKLGGVLGGCDTTSFTTERGSAEAISAGNCTSHVSC